MAKKKPIEKPSDDPYQLPENFIDIDEDQLWEEWRRQPKLVHSIALLSAEAKKSFADRKAALDVSYAEINISIRKDPGAFGLEKITDDVVKNLVIASEEVKTATRRMHRAKHRVDILQAALDALEHRKKALENMVDLWAMDYYATPQTSRPISKEKIEEVGKRNVRSRLSKKKRGEQ